MVIYNGDNELISNCVAKSMLTAREIAWSCKDIDVYKRQVYTQFPEEFLVFGQKIFVVVDAGDSLFGTQIGG